MRGHVCSLYLRESGERTYLLCPWKRRISTNRSSPVDIRVINSSSPVVIRVFNRSSPLLSRSSQEFTSCHKSVTWSQKAVRREKIWKVVPCHHLSSVLLTKNFHMAKLPVLLTGIKLDNICSAKLTSTWSGKIAHVLIEIIKLVIKFFLEKMVSSANQKVGMKVILGLSHQFIWMRWSGFIVEQNRNDSTYEESHLFQQSNLKML